MEVKFKELVALKKKGDCGNCCFCQFSDCSSMVLIITGINCEDGYMFKLKNVTYPVATPVAYAGSILFDNNTQRLCVNSSGKLSILGTRRDQYTDYRNDHIWVECTREELKCGDTAYRTARKDADLRFDKESEVCVIVDEDTYWFIANTIDGIRKSGEKWDRWFKLTRKDTIE